jgi:GNAT superfamily N-acetyltransferase
MRTAGGAAGPAPQTKKPASIPSENFQAAYDEWMKLDLQVSSIRLYVQKLMFELQNFAMGQISKSELVDAFNTLNQTGVELARRYLKLAEAAGGDLERIIKGSLLPVLSRFIANADIPNSMANFARVIAQDGDLTQLRGIMESGWLPWFDSLVGDKTKPYSSASIRATILASRAAKELKLEGQGRGHWQHRGRLGEQGGSLPADEGLGPWGLQQPRMRTGTAGRADPRRAKMRQRLTETFGYLTGNKFKKVFGESTSEKVRWMMDDMVNLAYEGRTTYTKAKLKEWLELGIKQATIDKWWKKLNGLIDTALDDFMRGGPQSIKSATDEVKERLLKELDAGLWQDKAQGLVSGFISGDPRWRSGTVDDWVLMEGKNPVAIMTTQWKTQRTVGYFEEGVPDYPNSQKWLYVDTLAAEVPKQGHGSYLMMRALEMAAKKGAGVYGHAAYDAVGFYRKIGGKMTGQLGYLTPEQVRKMYENMGSPHIKAFEWPEEPEDGIFFASPEAIAAGEEALAACKAEEEANKAEWEAEHAEKELKLEGSGRGHWRHRGRLGEQGGSLPADEGLGPWGHRPAMRTAGGAAGPSREELRRLGDAALDALEERAPDPRKMALTLCEMDETMLFRELFGDIPGMQDLSDDERWFVMQSFRRMYEGVPVDYLDSWMAGLVAKEDFSVKDLNRLEELYGEAEEAIDYLAGWFADDPGGDLSVSNKLRDALMMKLKMDDHSLWSNEHARFLADDAIRGAYMHGKTEGLWLAKRGSDPVAVMLVHEKNLNEWDVDTIEQTMPTAESSQFEVDQPMLYVEYLAAQVPRSGYGTHLMMKALQLAADKGWGLSGESVETARDFYAKLGARFIPASNKAYLSPQQVQDLYNNMGRPDVKEAFLDPSWEPEDGVIFAPQERYDAVTAMDEEDEMDEKAEGQGRGHWRHRGRRGEQGGSLPASEGLGPWGAGETPARGRAMVNQGRANAEVTTEEIEYRLTTTLEQAGESSEAIDYIRAVGVPTSDGRQRFQAQIQTGYTDGQSAIALGRELAQYAKAESVRLGRTVAGRYTLIFTFLEGVGGFTTAKQSLITKARRWLGLEPKETPTNAFMVWKEAGGGYRWFAVYSNKFRDEDYPPEILSSDAHIAYVDKVDKGLLPFPVLLHYHVPGTRWGVSDWLAFDEMTGFSMASGTVDKGHEQEAEAVAASASPLAVSHGMEVMARNDKDRSIIEEYASYEISDLPLEAAANKLTGFTVMEDTMGIPQQKKDYLRKVGLDDEAISKIEADLDAKAGTAKDAGLEFKEEQKPPVEPEAKKEEPKAEPEPEPEPTPAFVTRDEMTSAIAEAQKPLLEAVTTLTGAMTKMLKSEEQRIAEKAADTPALSIASLIMGQKSAIGKDATRLTVDQMALAKDKPSETKDVEVRTGIPFIDAMMAEQKPG